jgi:hypothetical protein
MKTYHDANQFAQTSSEQRTTLAAGSLLPLKFCWQQAYEYHLIVNLKLGSLIVTNTRSF